VLPLLVAGNTCVVLVSEADPRTALLLGELLHASEVPAGVVNLLSGSVAELVPHLLKHMDVAGLELHGLDATLKARLAGGIGQNIERVSVQSLAEDAWFDSALTESPRWIERFTVPKTVWQGTYP
jgi:acyl-CoA reductase-like NAD-dependent aldehyde dehydrogenase